jgi:hypothetical protein
MTGSVDFYTDKYFGPQDSVSKTLFVNIFQDKFESFINYIYFDVGVIRTTSDIIGNTFSFIGLTNEYKEHVQINKISN